jgi:sialate O-acetylesterase
MVQYDKRIDSFDAEQEKRKFVRAVEVWEKESQKRKGQGKKPRRKPRLRTDPLLHHDRPSNLFNGMIHPLVPYGMRGAIWYQGERNAKTIQAGELYATQLEMLIADWRARWAIGDFPFIAVQLPNFHKAYDGVVQNTGWVAVRESQMKSLALQNAGIAITTDVGMEQDIHPKNKQAVGRRLALWALGTTYNKNIVYTGPIFSSLQWDKEAKRGIVSFDHIGGGLKTSDGKPIRGFAIAGPDRVFHLAKAEIETSGGRVFVFSDAVTNPVAVRYNWLDNPSGNLVNSANLPAAPLRTDDWEIEDN